ncbi:uncharacterized protein LOC114935606 isoform X1 [Nylanderia fulva]|uniref:uncharacterized protein LOC114935606 isoform X1 n=1 Tax=Nylanderia fulva TaxID=613905 RepID=UPI0010FB2517|nr:uncharacterized protein LOC114935606 isoform X1 [Nylanderia fulva]
MIDSGSGVNLIKSKCLNPDIKACKEDILALQGLSTETTPTLGSVKNFLVKCGYCKQTCLNKEAAQHLCIREFDEFFVDPDTYKFWAYDGNEIVSELSDEHFARLENIANKENASININQSISNKKVKTSKKTKAPLNVVQLKLDQEEQ